MLIRVLPEMVREQNAEVQILSAQNPILFFDDFINCLAPLYKKETLPDFIKLPKPLEALMEGDFEPARVIDLRPIKEKLMYGDLRMWRNNSNKEFSLHGFGLIEDNKSKPSTYTLFDTSPHMFLGGATGHGKSVTLNDIIMAGSIVHPPWKVQYYLNDPKIVELKPYATYERVIPHVNAVAATEDPDYTISLLRYIIKIMEARNIVFEKAKVKNINAFNEATGLEMAMLVLVLDECKSMYLKAARMARVIDTLIELFVALARNAGGRCVMASQQVVTEMSADTMANVNIRACLGCNAKVSTAVVGNSGASINLGKMGKLTYNMKPGDGQIKDNVYLSSPFLPDNPTPKSKTIYEVFDYIHDKWELCGGGRLEPLSFFDEKGIIKRNEFLNYIEDKSSLKNFFLGEPAFIYKEKYNMYSFSLLPLSQFDVSLGANILCMSPITKIRYNTLALILSNLNALRKRQQCSVHVYSNIKDVQDKIRQFNFDVDKYDYSSDVEQLFYARMKVIMYRNIMCVADDKVFSGDIPEETELRKSVVEATELGRLSDLMSKRMYTLIKVLEEPKSRLILGIDELSQRSVAQYASLLCGFYSLYMSIDAEFKQALPRMFPTQFHIFAEFDQLKGVEIKTVLAKLEQWFDVVRMGPIYGVYTVITAGALVSSGSSLASAFNHLLFYAVPPSSLNPFKVKDEYPETIPKMLFVYVNKQLPSDFCFKVKFPILLEEKEE